MRTGTATGGTARTPSARIAAGASACAAARPTARRSARSSSRRSRPCVVLIAAIAAGTLTGASKALECDLTSLRPVTIGQNSFIYAADGSHARLDPGGEEPPAAQAQADLARGVPGDRRDRGPPLLLPRRRRRLRRLPRRLQEHRGRPDRRGRLDDHAAARPQPLHRERALVHAQGEGGLPRAQARREVVEGADPRDLPEPGLLRKPRLRDRGRVADVLLEAGQEALARRGGAPRRPAAGAVGLRPLQPAGRGGAAAKRRPARDAAGRLHRRRPVREGLAVAAQAEARRALHAHPRAVLLLVRARPADQGVRRLDRPKRRAQGLHDDRPALPGLGDRGDQVDASLRRTTRPPRSSRSTRRTARSAR